jgi:plastocyanin
MTLAILLVALAAGLAGRAVTSPGPAATVTGTISVTRTAKGPVDNGDVAIWLKPLAQEDQPANHATPQRLKIIQQNKRFEPHVLVVPAGSSVDFPNLDPFFHNVFSMFDGKRFDLGLYEAGTSRAVPFPRAGVSYIFCNIHPEMSAVVVVVDTPYFAVSNRAGEFSVPNLPPGRYVLSIWHERYKPETTPEHPRELIVVAPATDAGVIRLIESEDLIVPHKNKYGRDYTPPASTSPIYRDR